MTAVVPSWAPHLHRMLYEPVPDADGAAPTDGAVVPAAATTSCDQPVGPLIAHITETMKIAVQVLDGRRPCTQLSRSFARSAMHYWRVAADQHPRGAPPSRVLRVLVSRPAVRVAEVTAVVVIGGRVRAVPARFDRSPDRRWRCTAIRIL